MGYELSAEDLERVKRAFPKYLCALCLLVLRDPMQTPCAHLYCRRCLETLTVDKRKTKVRCHVDGTEFDIRKAFPDGCVNKEIMLLRIHCPNSDSDCHWEGEVKALEEHVKTCQHSKVRCVHKECLQMVKKNLLAEHLERDCTQRTVLCGYCETETKFCLLKHHQKECLYLPVTCSVCGKKGIQQSLLSQHLDPNTGDCDGSKAVCPFLALGCREREPMQLKERRNHEQSVLIFHVNLLFNAFCAFKDQMEKTLENIADLEPIKTNFSQLISQVMYITRSNGNTAQQLKGITTRVGKLEEQLGANGGSNSSSDIEILKRQFQEQANQLQECCRKLVNFEAKTENYEFLIGEANRTIEEQAQEITHLRRKNEETIEEVRRLNLNQGPQRNPSTTRSTNVSWDEMPSTGGTLMWKISNFAQQRQDAVSGRRTSFYSPSFYTSRYGYKMCSRIYLNGDGMGKGTHISLFFVLIRSEYDALLRWPFRQKVIMMILDQDNVEHVIDAFRPDPNSSSFQRPRREMNIASGCPLFCPLTELEKHGYVRDDVMFIKVIVDSSDA